MVQLPAILQGTLYTPHMSSYQPPPPLPAQVVNKAYTRHPFDGDGMVCSFAFRNGRAFFRNKFVRTKGVVDEQVGGGRCCRGMGGGGGCRAVWGRGGVGVWPWRLQWVVTIGS
jgi:carotenoid cleavage dioxygenase-like enzyme